MKIAIIRRNGLGDLVTTQPLILLCKEQYPNCHITLFVDARNKDLVPYLQGVDETVVIEPSPNKYVALGKTLWKNRHRTFDWIISARPKPMRWVNLFMGGLKALRKRAVVEGGWDSRWVDEPQKYTPDEKRHQMVKTLRILDPAIEEVPEHLLPRFQVKPTHQFGKPTLLISVSNQRVGSQLESETIARHLNQAAQNRNFHVVISCDKKDVTRAEQVAKLLTMTHEIIVTPEYPAFMGLLASVHGSWTGDGGIMHLMAALGKPQLVLFGRTELWEWAPLCSRAICLRHAANVNLLSENEIQQGLEALLNELR